MSMISAASKYLMVKLLTGEPTPYSLSSSRLGLFHAIPSGRTSNPETWGRSTSFLGKECCRELWGPLRGGHSRRDRPKAKMPGSVS